MLNISIITACIPSIKRFLADIQSGLMGVNISEPYEMTHSGGKYIDYGKGTTFGSKITSRFGFSQSNKSQNASSMGRSRGEKDPHNLGAHDMDLGEHTSRVQGGAQRGGGLGPVREASESVKGLTDDVIMHTIDYKVEYEDGGISDGRSSSGDRRENHSTYDVGVGR